MVDTLELEGLFWRPDASDRRMPGRLLFDVTDGARLTIIEPSLTLDGLGMKLDDGSVRFVGIAGSEVLTLERCYISGLSTKSNGLIQRQYRVSIILTGAHFGVGESLDFSGVSVQLTDLVQWVGRSSLSIDLRPKDEPGEAQGVKVRYLSLSPIEADSKDGSIAVKFSGRWQTDFFSKFEVEHKCAIDYRFHRLQPLANIIGICTSLRNLVTICVRAPAAIHDTRLVHPDLDRPVSLHMQWIGSGSRREQDIVHRSKMPLTFDDIGGVEGIRSWLELANKYSQLVAMLVSHWYTPPLYQEQRYFNAVVAAEMLVRIRQKDNRVNLGAALEDLAQEVWRLFEPLVGDLKRWVREVVQTRDNNVVHPGLRGNKDGHRLYLLSESIYALVVFALLRECGVSIEALKKSHDHLYFKELAADLATSAEWSRGGRT